MRQHIHIFGASGSGTTTIAKAVCNQLGCKHFDSDDYYWLQSREPFTVKRPQDECLEMMRKDLGNDEQWILSGSIANWGNSLIPFFDLVVFAYVPQDVRIERLRKREYERYGDSMLSGGRRYEATEEFLKWAQSYDSGTMGGRSLQKHELWLDEVKCPILKIINNDLENSVNLVINTIEN